MPPSGVGPVRQRSAFRLLATVQVTLILAITVVSVGLPAVQRDLGLRPGQLALVSAGYGLAFSGLLLVGGRASDLLGPRRLLVAGLVLFGGGSAAAGVAPGFGTLVGARLAQGTGAALAAPAALGLLGRVFPDPARHRRALAAWGGLAPVGATGGILVSGAAVSVATWRWAFAVPVVVAAIAVIAIPRLLPRDTRPARTPLNVPGALLVTVGIVGLSHGLVTAGDRGLSSPDVVVALAAGAVALVGFAAVESRSAAPLVPRFLLGSPRRLAGSAAVLLAAAGQAAISYVLALHLQQVRDLSPLATSATFIPFGVALAVAGAVASRLVARVGPAFVTVGGLLVGAAGLLLVARLGLRPEPGQVGALAPGLLVLPVGTAAVFAGATVLAVGDAPPAHQGMAGGVVNTAVELGASVGLAGLVSLAGMHTSRALAAGEGPATATTGGYALALTVAATVFAVGAGAGLLAIARRRRSGTPMSRRLEQGGPR